LLVESDLAPVFGVTAVRDLSRTRLKEFAPSTSAPTTTDGKVKSGARFTPH
jgi:hypothetical protein